MQLPPDERRQHGDVFGSVEHMQELEREFHRIGVSGKNAPPEYLSVHDIGSYIGSSSRGSHGNSPLAEKGRA